MSRTRFFEYKGEVYMRVIPTKTLFRSTTVHQVVNRGDFFAVNMNSGLLTVLPGGSDANINT